MPTVQTKTPLTDHLWQLGFTIEAKADRLPVPIPDEKGNAFKVGFQVTAYPERGEARKFFAAKGPAFAEVKSNIDFEVFALEQREGTNLLRELYTEQAAKVLFEMLANQAPTISKPRL